MLKYFCKTLIDYLFRRKSLITCLYVVIVFLLSQLAAIGQSSEILKYCNYLQGKYPDDLIFHVAQFVKIIYADGNLIAIISSAILILVLMYLIKPRKPLGEDAIISINSNSGITIQQTTSGPHFWIQIDSLGGGSTRFKIKSVLLLVYNDGSVRLAKIDLFVKNEKIPHRFYRSLWPFDPSIKEIYLHLRGSYSNLSQSTKYRIDDLYHFKPNEGITRKLLGDGRKEVLKKYKEARGSWLPWK